MSKKVLIRKQAGSGGIMYTREVGGRGQGGFMQDLAAVRGGARGLVTDPNTNNVRQGFIPGSELGAAKPTGMQRLAAGANLAGRGLAAALTGLQTAYSLQGGNVGALGNMADTYAATVPGLTVNNQTEAQQAQDMATEAFNTQQQQMANDAMQQSAQQTMNQPVNVGSSSPRGPAPTTPPAGLPTPPVPAPAASAPAAPAPAPATPAPATLASANFNPQQPLTTNQNDQLKAAAQLLGSANVAHQSTRTTGQGNPIPQYSGPMSLQQSPAVDNGLTPHQGALPVMMPEQRHEQQRQMVTPPDFNETGSIAGETSITSNPFYSPEKTIQQHMIGRRTIPGTAYGGLNRNTVKPDSIHGANFGVNAVKWGSLEPSSLGDDESIRWKAFALAVLNDFGDMLHKADPHVAGAVAMRVFLEKMLRK